jgi:hypothetical protein
LQPTLRVGRCRNALPPQDLDDIPRRDDDDRVIIFAQLLVRLRSQIAGGDEDAELAVSEP